jgi:nuclear pore complex protein Nup205
MGRVKHSDGSRVATTVEALTSFLRLWSFVFNLVTLDLHILTNCGHLKTISEFLEHRYARSKAATMLPVSGNVPCALNQK